MAGRVDPPDPGSGNRPVACRVLVVSGGRKPLPDALRRFLAGAPPEATVLHCDPAEAEEAAPGVDAALVCHPLVCHPPGGPSPGIPSPGVPSQGIPSQGIPSPGRRSGFRLAARLARGGAGTVVLLSAAPDATLRHRAAQAGIAVCVTPAELSWPLLQQALALRRAEQRLAAVARDRSRLIDRLSEAVLDLDEAGRVRACSPAVAGLLGWPAAGISGRSAAVLLPAGRAGQRRAARLERMLSLLRRRARRATGGSTWRGPVRLRHRDGRLLWLDLQVIAAGQASDGLTCILRDPGGEGQWRWEPESFRLVVEHSPAGVLVTDAEGRIEYANPRFAELSGWEMGDLLGRTPRLLGAGQTSRAVYDELWQTIRAGRIWRGILRNRHRDGSLYWTENRIAPIRDGQGRITHFVAIEEDVTAAKERESALQRAKTQAEVASQAKSMLLAHVSHELRTPMNAIIGFSQLMEAETFGPIGPRYRDYAADILQAGRHLLSVIEDLLDLSRIEAGGGELDDIPFAPAEQVEACLRMVMPRLRAGGQRLAVDLQPGLPRLRGDPLRFRQILLNLLSNSLKFTPAGGEIAVRLRLHRRAGGSCGCCAAEDGDRDGLDLVVQDSGPGMSEREIALARIPFALVDDPMTRRHGGAGLGLSLATALAERHDGSLAIDSEAGRGTMIRVHFPQTRLEPGGPAAVSAPGARGRRQGPGDG